MRALLWLIVIASAVYVVLSIILSLSSGLRAFLAGAA
jgi:hypothetical protein